LPVREEDQAPEGKARPWWARTDAELVKDRFGRFREVYDSVKIKVDEEDREPLIREAARIDPRIVNLLDMVPQGRKGIRRKGDFLLVPVYRSRTGERIAGFMGLKTTRRIRLDDYGWMVWKLINGRRDVRRIGRLLRNRYGRDVEPLYPRLSKFLAYLKNLELIRIKEPQR
ncbi:MAG: PqqD family protein, partial [Thermoplasmatota archaeon]